MTITIVSFAVSLFVLCADNSSVCAFCNQQIPRRQPAEWHDPDLYWTIYCAHLFVSDDFNFLVCAVSLFVFVCWWQQCVICEIKETSAPTCWMARFRPLSVNWLRSLVCKWRLQFFRLRCLSVLVRVLMTAVCSLWNRQTALQQPAEWQDLDLFWTIDCAPVVVSDDYNSLFCTVSLFVFVCWWQQFVLCEINRALNFNQLNGTIPSFIGQFSALQYLSVTITVFSLALSLCSCSCADKSSVCFVTSTDTSTTTNWMAMCLQSMRPLWLFPVGIVFFSHYRILFLDMTFCCCVVVRLQSAV